MFSALATLPRNLCPLEPVAAMSSNTADIKMDISAFPGCNVRNMAAVVLARTILGAGRQRFTYT